VLTLGRDCLWRRLRGVGQRPAMVVGAVVFGGSRKQGDSVGAVRGEVGSRAGPFIGAGRSVRGRKIFPATFGGGAAAWPVREESGLDLGR
jgi:hypothetical protein